MTETLPASSHLRNAKKRLRHDLRQQRQALSPQHQKNATLLLLNRLCQHQLFIASQKIAFYLANDGEINPYPLLEQSIQLGKQCYLPVIQQNLTLAFRRYTPDTKLVINSFGIPEPARGKLLKAQHLDLILTPLVGYDRYRKRLGMGGGFYDRSLNFKKNAVVAKKPWLAGLAHQCQEVKNIPCDPWDIRLDAVFTDRRVISQRKLK